MNEWLVPGLLALIVMLLSWLLLQPRSRKDAERLERELRTEVQDSARGTRQELAGHLSLFQQTLLTQSGDVARTQNEQIDSFRTQLATMQQQVGEALHAATRSLAAQSQAARDAQDASLKRLSDSLGAQLQALSAANERRLAALQEGNEKKLEQMRATVDEKLHATLEHRLGESFKQVADRLEQVHKGLGEMQTLARDVGSLNRVLSNVKTRGIFGEVQLAALLEQVLTPPQYAVNVATVPGSTERVEFAIRLPGQRDDGQPLWLPIDAKFPREDYERLLDAQERARPAGDGSGGGAASKPGCGWRREASATSTLPRRIPPTSPSCSCPPKVCMPRRCAARGWCRRCRRSTRSCSPARPRCWPR